MKRTRFGARGRLGREAEQLIWLATGLSRSGSRIEDRFWDERLSAELDRLLQTGAEEVLDAALDHLSRTNGRAYDELADLVESRIEGIRTSGNGTEWDTLMIAAPVLAWSRYSIPAGSIPEEVLATAKVQLRAHALAAGTRLALADFLFSPDQLPRSYVETYGFSTQLADAAVAGRDLHLDPQDLPETTQFLSDMRYLVGVIAAPRGGALFRWQEPDGSRETAASQWRTQGGACVQPLLTGCAIELLLPDAYHAACREADRHARPYSVRASISFLETTLNVQPAGLRAIVAPFYDNRLEEYRIGFTLRDRPDVVHGVVWPLLDAEDEGSEVAAQIEATLQEFGVKDVTALDHRFPLEYCDDCGAPLYPNPEGETEHAELPEQDEPRPVHLH
jgi:hypothetical protein